MSDPTDPAATTTAAAAEPAISRVPRGWFIKQVIIVLVLLVFGFWGMADAFYIYPKRGREAAEALELQYLQQATAPGVTDAVGVPDPVAELAKLREANEASLSPLRRARRDWLVALKNVGMLAPEHTKIDSPTERAKELTARWTAGEDGKTISVPKPLNSYDIPVQYLIMAVGWGGGVWCLVVLVNALRTKYRWDEATQTLTLPSGVAFRPGDVEDFDKRKWDKFLVFVKFKSSFEPLAGQELKIDLLRHVPVEDWILAMEKTAFPERAAELERQAEEAAQAAAKREEEERRKRDEEEGKK
jgi:hypothetical protein